MNWLSDFFKAIIAGFNFGTKIIPPDEIRLDNHNEKKELRQQDFSQAMINDDFSYIKRRTEINIADYLAYVHPTLEGLDKYTEIVSARVIQFRKDHPIIYHKWLKANGYK